MKTADYWKDRFEQIEKICHDKGAVSYRKIEEQYRKAQKEIESQISVWYQRFAVNNGITMQEARRLLTSGELAELKWDVNEYIKYGRQNAIDGKWMKQLENASAKAHISRLEALKLQVQQQVEVAFGNQLDSIDSTMRAVYSMGYMHTAFEIQKGVGVGHNFAALNQRLIDEVLKRPWAPDGKNFSDRVWSNKQKLINELNTTLTQGIILGKDPGKIINAMSKKLDVSKTAAGRLVMTESAAFTSRAQEDCFKELDVEEYEIVATLDSHTSEICQDMDGKVFKMPERQIGVNAPPFHVNCRTTTAPYFDDWEELGIDRERVARNDKGDKYFVDGNTTYKEWEKQYANKDADGDGKALNIDTQSGKINDKVMNGLSSISQIKSDNDIKQFAEKLIDNLGIDRSNIPVNIKAIQDNGYCRLGSRTTRNKLYFDEYVLNSNDARSMNYRIKTAFHESFHLSANGLEWDGLDSSGSIAKEWRSLEETFTESSAHYLINKYGFSDKLSPSYAQELVENLPRLKKLTKYSSCSTIQDFGEIAFKDRQNGVGAKWLQLHSDMSNVILPTDYYSQYNSYIANNEDDLFDMFFENLVGYSQYRSQMKAELKSAMGKDFWLLSGNEKLVYSNILACAMQKVGVL
jgi:phage head morphogenesis protein, SPP1 gp7 family